MPIPTRSGSLREPRKQTTGIGRVSTNNSISTSTPVLKPTNGSARRIEADPSKPNPSLSDAAGSVFTDNVSNRRKSFLPQRNNSVRADGLATKKSQFQPLESRLPQRGLSPQNVQRQEVPEEQHGSTMPARRQSLVRPGDLKMAPLSRPVASTIKSVTVPSTRPPSPRKLQMPTTKTTAPSSPKKTEMPLPPRPARSASLKQPVTPSSVTPAGLKGHTRHRSQVITGTTSQLKKQMETTPLSTAQRTKPGFSTYQQSFTPKKPAAKPPTPTPSSTASIDSDPSLISSSWPEIAALQTELLQLNLLHSTSLRKHSEWQINSEMRLRKKYDSVAETYRSVLAEEKEVQRRVNYQALSQWLKNSREGTSRQGFSEQIQALSHVVQEVSDLNDRSGGRYTLAIQVFEDWFQHVHRMKRERERSNSGELISGVAFIESIGHSWKEELGDLIATLELCSRRLQGLDILGYEEMESLNGSALIRIAKGTNEVINLMTDEVNAIRRIEADVVKSERLWVRQLTEQMAAEQPTRGRETRIGLWKTALR